MMLYGLRQSACLFALALACFLNWLASPLQNVFGVF